MMKETTKKAFEMMKEEFGNRLFFEDEIKMISVSTFHRYRKEMNIEKVIIEEEWSLEKVIELLNSCARSDCYEADWFFSLKDGKIVESSKEAYRFL